MPLIDDIGQWMTTEQLLAMPDDGIERELIKGKLRESGMTRRGMPHATAGAKITTLLEV
jgi:hypothetical protein